MHKVTNVKFIAVAIAAMLLAACASQRAEDERMINELEEELQKQQTELDAEDQD